MRGVLHRPDHEGKVVHYQVNLKFGDIPYEHWEQAVRKALEETERLRWRHQVRRVVLDEDTSPKVRWLVQKHSFALSGRRGRFVNPDWDFFDPVARGLRGTL